MRQGLRSPGLQANVGTEMTPKPLKALQTLGFVLLVVGVIARAGAGEYWGTGLAMLGLALFFLGRFLAWWKNG